MQSSITKTAVLGEHYCELIFRGPSLFMLQSSSSDRLRYLKAIKVTVQSMKLQSAESEGLREKGHMSLCVHPCVWFGWLALLAPVVVVVTTPCGKKYIYIKFIYIYVSSVEGVGP